MAVINENLMAVSTMVSIAGGFAGLGWFMSFQFRKGERQGQGIKDAILEKLDTARETLEAKITATRENLETRINDHEDRDNDQFGTIDLKILTIELREQSAGKSIGPHQI